MMMMMLLFVHVNNKNGNETVSKNNPLTKPTDSFEIVNKSVDNLYLSSIKTPASSSRTSNKKNPKKTLFVLLVAFPYFSNCNKILI